MLHIERVGVNVSEFRIRLETLAQTLAYILRVRVSEAESECVSLIISHSLKLFLSINSLRVRK